MLYPVGSCYFSTNAASPASLIGGTWNQMTGGMLGLTGSIGVVDSGYDGGSREILINNIQPFNINVAAYTSNYEMPGLGLTQTTNFQNRVLVSTNIKPETHKNTIASGGGGGLHPRSHCCLWLETCRLASSEVNS